jgi:hypothetical protein
VVLSCCDDLIGDKEYFNKLWKWWCDASNQGAVFEALITMKTDRSLIKIRPKNELYDDIKLLSADKQLLFLKDQILSLGVSISTGALFTKYKTWLLANGYDDYRPGSPNALGVYIKSLNCTEKRKFHGVMKLTFDVPLLTSHLIKKGVMQPGE